MSKRNEGTHPGALVRAGVWETKIDWACLNVFEQDGTKSKSSKVYSALRTLYEHIGDEHYQQTSVATDWFFGGFPQDLPKSGPVSGLQAIRYPSTLRSDDHNLFDNFVFSKDFLDKQGLELVRWYHFEVMEKKDESCVVRSIATGSREKEGMSNDGQLIWKENPSTGHVLVPPGANVKFTFDGFFWVPDQPLEGFSPFIETNW